MTSLILPRRFIALAAGALIAAPGASAAKADLVVYFDRTFRGDITVTNGNVSKTPDGKSVGSYSTSTTAYAIIGGTGRYVGVSGELVLKPSSATWYKASFFFRDQ